MRSETSEKHKPEDMLLRVIRAAQILIKGQDQTTANTSYNKPNNPIDRSTDRAQKTQN